MRGLPQSEDEVDADPWAELESDAKESGDDMDSEDQSLLVPTDQAAEVDSTPNPVDELHIGHDLAIAPTSCGRTTCLKQIGVTLKDCGRSPHVWNRWPSSSVASVE